MEARLTRSVEIPERGHRPLLAAAALAVLFACGAHNYMMAAARARLRTVELTFDTVPAGADVVRERDGELICRTPCSVVHDVGRFGVAGFRFVADGYEDRRVLVNMTGGDVRVEAVLAELTEPPPPQEHGGPLEVLR